MGWTNTQTKKIHICISAYIEDDIDLSDLNRCWGTLMNVLHDADIIDFHVY